MNGRGRPLRFLALVALGWAGARTVILWPEGATVAEAIEAVLPIQPAEAEVLPPITPVAGERASARVVAATVLQVSATSRFSHPMKATAPTLNEAVGQAVPATSQLVGAPPGVLPPAPLVSLQAAPTQSRWSASAWFVTRRGAPAGGALLGGDQAGLRVAYALDTRQRLRLYARATAPLAVAGREVAAGIEWQPTRLPVRIVAEQRVGLDEVRGGPALAVIGGVDAVGLPLDFKLEAYGQAGAVWRGQADPFADGAARILRPVIELGELKLALGGGVWGALQREAARLDVGPSVTATLPLGKQAVKLSVDWRERVAGDARPGSGPAVTLGADF